MASVTSAKEIGEESISGRTLAANDYRAGVESGAVSIGIATDNPARDERKPTVVFIHGADGRPSQFAALAQTLDEHANSMVFLYDDRDRLAPTAEVLRKDLLQLQGAVAIVAHSMGALLPAYVGATDPDRRLRCMGAVYLNPLIGGSRYADDIPVLRWLRPLKPLIQRVLFRPSVQDLAPESTFEQTIFGSRSGASSFAAHTIILFTEVAGEEPDILADRIPFFFGRTRAELLDRTGMTVQSNRTGHSAPLADPDMASRLILEVLERVTRCSQPEPGRA